MGSSSTSRAVRRRAVPRPLPPVTTVAAVALVGVVSLLAPEIVTPVQATPDRPRTPELRLAHAVLMDGILCRLGIAAYAKDESRRTLQLQAMRWMNNHDATDIHSFESICLLVDFSADAIREGVQRLLRAGPITNSRAKQWRRHLPARWNNKIVQPRKKTVPCPARA